MVKTMLTLQEAQARLLGSVTPLAVERVAVEASVGRVIAESIASTVRLPPFDNSAMDGYAIELETKGDRRSLAGESRAGSGGPSKLAPGTAMRIFTGAPIPEGADAVVMQEHVSLARDAAGEAIVIARPVRAGENIRRAGEDLELHAPCFEVGDRLRATHLPLLQSLGRSRVTVRRRPVVSILSTGDELRESGDAPRPGSIAETNAAAIAVMCEAEGAIVRRLPIVRDDRAELRAAVEAALEGVDVALTIGGVSVGDHDLVRPVLEEVGVAIDFWKVAIKPGKPIALGRRGATTVLGLPGNPVSALVTFVLFGAPLVRAMAGDRSPLPDTTRARLGRSLTRPAGRLELMRVTLSRAPEGDLLATPVSSQSSGSVVSIARADGLAMLPLEATELQQGAWVEVIRLDR
ncbi:MAG: gephyrin-like molybdotransferase Glp [Polyangiales bacterium]